MLRIAATRPLGRPCHLQLPAMSNLLQVCYRTEVFDSARPFCAHATPNSIGMSSVQRQRLCSIRCVSGMWARSLERASLPGCTVHCQCQRPLCPLLDARLFRPEQLNQRLSAGSPGRGLAADPSWWVLPTRSHRDLADGWEWRQPLPSDRFASALPSWFVLPWPRVNAENPPSQPLRIHP